MYVGVYLRTGLVFAGVGLQYLVVDPHVCDRHAVLCQRAGLVGADGRRRAQCLHRLQILHQTVLTRHPLGSQRQTHLTHHLRLLVKIFVNNFPILLTF